ncbi:MAG: Protein YzbB [Candidatus Rifleibacterium amylolyticum]|nr:MAG: Protein YzbB [Candidatus Rifleibacterium amylolyticum]
MFKPGIEVFFENPSTRGSRRVAAVTNFTGRNRNGRHLVNLLAASSNYQLTRIFTPEHGFTSDAPDGEHVADSRESDLGVEIISLYGPNKKPDRELLNDIDLLIYDIQDLGVRFYTYISTLRNILDAASEVGLPVIILDRPDVMGGRTVEGPMLEPEFTSFVGHLPIALRYGLTPGELAKWWHARNGMNNELSVVCCEDYRCPTEFDELNFPWFKPSPSMPDVATALMYPGTCLFEGTNISEGRGSDHPFRNLGAPFINADKWLECIKPLLSDKVSATTCSFVPTFSKFTGETCFGIRLSSEHPIDDAVYTGVAALWSLAQSHPGVLEFTGRPGLEHPFIDYLAGTDRIRKGLISGDKPNIIIENSSDGCKEFAGQRQRFFLYRRD